MSSLGRTWKAVTRISAAQVILLLSLSVLSVLSPLMSVDAHAATTTVTVTTCQTITTLHQGDKVSGTVTLSTSDPDENGEGEPLVLTSSGGFSSTIGTYEVTQTFSFVASVEGETLSGCISGYDADESASIIVTTNSTQQTRFTQQQKNDMNKWGGNLNIVAAGSATVAAGCLLAPDPSVTKVCGVVAGGISGLSWLSSAILQRLALDPSDPNYKVIAQPVTPSLSQQPYTTAQGFTQQEADALNALFTNMEQVIGLGRAMLITIDRAQGAHDAGDQVWEANQVQALHQYAGQMANLYDAQPALFANLQNALQAGGFPTFTFTSSDVFNFESSVLSNGLPSSITQVLTELGADSATQDQIRRVAYVQDTNAVAALGGGRFPNMLTDPFLTSALQGLGQLFHQFAGTTTTSGQTYIKINNGNPLSITGTEQPQIVVQFGNQGTQVNDIRVVCNWTNLIRFNQQVQNGPFSGSEFVAQGLNGLPSLYYPKRSVTSSAQLPDLPQGQNYNVAFGIRLQLPNSTFKGTAGNIQCFLLDANFNQLAQSQVVAVNVH